MSYRCPECHKTASHKMDCTIGRKSVRITSTRRDSDAEAIGLGFDTATNTFASLADTGSSCSPSDTATTTDVCGGSE